jgi:hypothetical protein
MVPCILIKAAFAGANFSALDNPIPEAFEFNLRPLVPPQTTSKHQPLSLPHGAFCINQISITTKAILYSPLIDLIKLIEFWRQGIFERENITVRMQLLP